MNTQGDRPRWRGWLIEGLILIGLLVAIHFWQTRNLAAGPAPQLPEGVEMLHGAGLPAARPLLVHFWASWCPICGLEQGSIQALADDHAVITIATQSGGVGEVRRHLAQEGLTFPTLIDENGEIAAQWGVRGFPATFIVDGDGMIRYKTQGYATGWGLRIRLWLAQ